MNNVIVVILVPPNLGISFGLKLMESKMEKKNLNVIAAIYVNQNLKRRKSMEKINLGGIFGLKKDNVNKGEEILLLKLMKKHQKNIHMK